MIKPTAMATIRLLIDRLIIDPDSFRRLSLSMTEMAALPLGIADFADAPQDPRNRTHHRVLQVGSKTLI
jgi:hypothetical protein